MKPALFWQKSISLFPDSITNAVNDDVEYQVEIISERISAIDVELEEYLEIFIESIQELMVNNRDYKNISYGDYKKNTLAVDMMNVSISRKERGEGFIRYRGEFSKPRELLYLDGKVKSLG